MVPWMIVPVHVKVLQRKEGMGTEFTILELDRHRFVCTFHEKPTSRKSQSGALCGSLKEEEAQLMPELRLGWEKELT